MAVTRMLTYADLLEMPEERRELLGGELHRAASPSMRHQRVVRKLGMYLVSATLAGYGEVWYAPFDVYFDQHNVPQPDLFFVRTGREHIVHDDKVMGPPDLIVEILSPGTARVDLNRGPKGKLGIYEEFGVPYYWVVNPDELWIDVYAADQGRYPREPVRYVEDDVLVCPLFPALPLRVGDLFW